MREVFLFFLLYLCQCDCFDIKSFLKTTDISHDKKAAFRIAMDYERQLVYLFVLLFVNRFFLTQLLNLAAKRQVECEEEDSERERGSADDEVPVGEVPEGFMHQ